MLHLFEVGGEHQSREDETKQVGVSWERLDWEQFYWGFALGAELDAKDVVAIAIAVAIVVVIAAAIAVARVSLHGFRLSFFFPIRKGDLKEQFLEHKLEFTIKFRVLNEIIHFCSITNGMSTWALYICGLLAYLIKNIFLKYTLLQSPFSSDAFED